MYRCQSCGELVPAGVRTSWVTTKVRRKAYPFRQSAIPVAGKGKKRRRKDDKGGQGWERVEMKSACDSCIDRMAAMEPEVVGSIEPVEVVEEAPIVEEEQAAAEA
ncbi:MAG: hypothetical protein CL927_03605 [Deltaproteobacteria bacterium]|nr:hypothetical protein [Deltaproteobacteria bacterium]